MDMTASVSKYISVPLGGLLLHSNAGGALIAKCTEVTTQQAQTALETLKIEYHIWASKMFELLNPRC